MLKLFKKNHLDIKSYQNSVNEIKKLLVRKSVISKKADGCDQGKIERHCDFV